MTLRRQSKPADYLRAVLVVAAVTALRLFLDDFLNVRERPFLLYYVAVILSGWFGGLGAGLLATGLAALCIDLLFLGTTNYSLRLRPEDVLPLATFVVEGALISVLAAMKRRAFRDVEQARSTLEDTVARRTEALRQSNATLLQQLEENQRIQEELRAFSAQLERSNRELQDFASVASHDLQEPLRKIQAFGDRLKTRFDPQLGPDGQDYLARMQNAAGRMQVLINDLLTFSRVTTRAQPFVAVDLAHVAREVVSDLEARIEQTGARVEVGDLPTIDADPTQIRQLLQNLIGNALKFQAPGRPPLVRVHAAIVPPDSAAADPLCELTVSDNGIGFDEKYLDRIFNIFQRLHGRGAYEGTGIGLAVCRKIVERHAGTITARSVPDEGTTFLVRLPVHRVEHEKAASEKITAAAQTVADTIPGENASAVPNPDPSRPVSTEDSPRLPPGSGPANDSTEFPTSAPGLGPDVRPARSL